MRHWTRFAGAAWSRENRRRFLPGVVVLLIGTALSLASAYSARDRELRSLQADFDAAADNRVSALRREVVVHFNLLRALADLMSSSEHREFSRLLATASKIHPVRYQMRWAPRVTSRQRQQFEQYLRSTHGHSGGICDPVNGRLVPSPDRAEYYPISLTEPTAGDGISVLGLDVSARPEAKPALERARRTGKPSATQGFLMVQRSGKEPGVVTYVPVLRRGELAGFLTSVIYPADMLEHGLKNLKPHGIHIEVFDDAQPRQLLYTHQSRRGGTATLGLIPSESMVEVGDRRWLVRCTASSAGSVQLTSYPWLVLGAGWFVSVLIGAYLNVWIAKSMRIEKEVAHRTRQLTESTRRLEIEIAERRAAEQAAGAARDEALAASRIKSQFLANVSHELRTPIHGIVGNLGILSESQMDDEQQECVRMLQRTSRALRDLVEDILDMSRIEAGVISIGRESFALCEAVREAVAAVRFEADSKKLSISIDVDESAFVVGDARRVRQVLLNLLGNAVKFTSAGSVAVLARRLDEERWRFEVKDTGTGISEGNRAIVFRRFVQVDGTHSRRHGGLGLGLAISRQLVELMGGAIGVESEPGAGSVFWFEVSLPGAAAPPQGAPAPVRICTPGAGRGRVLLAEDNPVNRKVGVWQLRKLGFEAECATDGRQAIELLDQGRQFDAILMDCQMPVMDGFEATAEIRRQEKRYRRIPIIAVTANAMTGDRERCLGAGMDDYLSKPLEAADLERVLARWVPETAAQAPENPVPTGV